MTEAEQIAQFMATRGVTRVAEADRSLPDTSRDWVRRVRGEPTTDDLIRQRHVTIGGNGREYVKNGLGERIS